MNKRSYLSILLVMAAIAVVVLLMVTGGETLRDPAQPEERYFRMNIGTEPPSLDPVEIIDSVSIGVLQNMMRGLTFYDAQGNVVPACAERWDISPDRKRYVFHLREDCRWNDGQPVTAHDFVYAWRRVLNSDNAAAYAFLLFDIENAQAYFEKEITDPGQIGAKALDDRTLEVRLKRPTAFFLEIVAFTISLPLRQDVVEAHPDTFTEPQYYLTNGPFNLVKWDHESEIVLEPNPHYWDPNTKLKGALMYMIPEPNTSLIMYENNELDFVETLTSLPAKEVRRVQDRPDYHTKTTHGISYIGFNTQKPPMDDPKVRKAFCHAFDRTYIPKLFQAGEQPESSWISPGLFAYNREIGLKFDMEKAQEYLTEAGYPNGEGFPQVELMYANNTPENRQIAEIAQFQWKEHLNISVELESVEWKVYLKQLAQDPPPIFRLQWYVDYPDPDSFLSVYISVSGNNFTRWQSDLYDEWVARAAVEKDAHKRATLYDKAQTLLLEEVAAICPLYVIPKSYLVQPDVQGFQLSPLNQVVLDNVHFAPTP